jgi:cysteine desulfurase
LTRIYLDDAGSAPVLPEVRQVVEGGDVWGNPSSPHSEGRSARAKLDLTRDVIAALTGFRRTEITFVSSGTEAVNLALFGARGPLVTWAAEHQSVLGAARRLQAKGREVTIAAVDPDARVDPDVIKPGTALVSVGLANNEVGTIQPVAEVIARAHDVGALVHVDACCGARWIPIPVGADLVSISGHKLGAGRGGMLYVRDGVKIEPLLYGGPQEYGRRAGQEDVLAAAALTAAMVVIWSKRRDQYAEVAARQSELLRSTLRSLGGTLTGGEDRLPNFATCTFADRKGEDMLLALDLSGVAASSGSACASGSLDPSHVLLAMGLSMEQALGSLRLTTGYATTDEEIDRAVDVMRTALSRPRTHA